MIQVHMSQLPFFEHFDQPFKANQLYGDRDVFLTDKLLCGKYYRNLIYKNFVIHLQNDIEKGNGSKNCRTFVAN